MDQLDIADRLATLTKNAHRALTRNAPEATNKSDILDAITDIVFFVRDKGAGNNKELLFAIARDKFIMDVFSKAKELKGVGVHKDVLVDFIARDSGLAQVFHQLIRQGDVVSALQLLDIAQTDLQSFTSNSELDQIIKPVNSPEFSWEIPTADQQRVIKKLVGILEEIAADPKAVTSFHRNSRYLETCEGYSDLIYTQKDPDIGNRIKSALVSMPDRFPPDNEVITR